MPYPLRAFVFAVRVGWLKRAYRSNPDSASSAVSGASDAGRMQIIKGKRDRQYNRDDPKGRDVVEFATSRSQNQTGGTVS